MTFISTEGMTNDTAPEGSVLVQYLAPFFGELTVDFCIAHYDNPKDYIDGGIGWVKDDNVRPINVIAYTLLPKAYDLIEIDQAEFLAKYKTQHPKLGSLGELIKKPAESECPSDENN